MIALNKLESLNDMIQIAIRINNRQHERYIDKKMNIKTHSTKRFFKENLMKLNVIKIKKLKIKTYYSYEKKNHLKKNCLKKTIKITKE